MAFSASSGQPNQTPQSSIPALSQKEINTGTWGANSVTCLITDANIRANSTVIAYVTGTTAPAGRWAYTVANGTCTITSSDAESSTLAMAYIVL